MVRSGACRADPFGELKRPYLLLRKCGAVVGRGVDAFDSQDLPDGGGGDLDVECGEFTVCTLR